MRAASMSICANNDDGPDAEVKQFRFDGLKVTPETMYPAPERNDRAGVLATRTGQFCDSIRLQRDTLPGIGKSNPARAEVAIET
jgi:hypothetical protein